MGKTLGEAKILLYSSLLVFALCDGTEIRSVLCTPLTLS
jgi:hypothetical protein